MTPRLRLVTDAVSEPVVLQDAKLYCRVDGTEEDDLITALIVAARKRIEKETGLALLTQTWTAVFDRWPGHQGQGLADWWDGVREAPISLVTPTMTVEIPKRPFQAVTLMQLRDAYGAMTTVDPSIYFVECSDMVGRINRKLGQMWPVVVLAPTAAIEVTFTAGFDNAYYGNAVPADLLTVLKMLVKHWYDNRDVMQEGRAMVMPHHISEMMQPYRNSRLR